jgi:hypothetical protein
MSLQSKYRWKGQPLGGEDRPGLHCDHDGVALNDFPVDLDARYRVTTLAAHDTGDLSEAQFGSLRLRRPHHRGGECFGMNLSRGFRRAQALVHDHTRRQPVEPIEALGPAEPRGTPIGGETAIAPVPAELLG